ncbi:MAG TPA: CocE/NonD family hydrolase [Longimicrobiaceae bacterium]|nr:CocE/NonD family hydrolase [Longimicrobiaceae bacterium]
MPRISRFLPAIAGVLVLLAGPAPAQEVDSLWVREHYAKREVLVPMRDGVRLHTAIYTPKDAAAPRPILFRRSPYGSGPYGADRFGGAAGAWAEFMRAGYIMVQQDVRGRYLSEGVFEDVRPQRTRYAGPADVDESTDAWDAIDWLVRNVPGNNGRVGMYGVSYPGFYTITAGINAHPALRVISPQAPVADWFVGDDFHHNGALYLAHAFHFFSGFGRPRPAPTTQGKPGMEIGTPDGYRFFLELGPLPNVKARFFGDSIAFWDRMMEHPTYDAFWQARNLLPHLRRLPPAVLTVGGWFDAEDLYGPLNVYAHAERQSPGIANHLVMGPWDHGGWGSGPADQLGDVRFGPTGPFYRDSVFLPFFRHHLEDAPDPRLAEATVFETGTNLWRRYATWPPRGVRRRSLYLREGGGLAFEAPPALRGAAAYDEYVSDPAHPVPHIGWISPEMTYEHMVADQRFAATRPDVLVYRGEALDADLTVAGPITVTLHVSTSGTDADWVVKLIDVYPDSTSDPEPNPTGVRLGGYQQLVRGEVFRGRFRNGFDRPEPFVPGRPARVEYVMPDVNHTFRRGHRIMVQVQSSWFPLVDRNPQTFVDIYHARAEDFRAATQRVYRSAALPSRVTVGVLEPGGGR